MSDLHGPVLAPENLQTISYEILDALPSHTAILDQSGVIIFVNRAWRDFAVENGYSGSSFWLGSNYLATCGQAEGECSDEAGPAAGGLRSVLSGEQAQFELEYPCHSQDEERWFRMLVTPVRASGWQGAIVMHINITERVQAEMRVRENDSKSRLLLDTTIDAIISTDRERRIHSANAAASGIFGYEPQELDGQPIDVLLAGADWRLQPQPREALGRRKSGEQFPIDLAVNEFHSGTEHLLIGTIRDISERKASETRRGEEIRSLKTLSGAGVRTRVHSLRRDAPEVFDECVREYQRILELALEQRVLKVDHGISGRLRDLANRLFGVHAGPRDIVAIHVSTMDTQQTSRIPDAKLQGYLHEGRLLVLELMGDLLSCYRDRAAESPEGSLPV